MNGLITVAETSLFVKQSEAIWKSEERLEFIDSVDRAGHARELGKLSR